MPRVHRLLALCLLLLAPGVQPALAQSVPFTLEAVLSFAHPSDLVAAPSGDRVAWVSTREGVRNVWVAEGPAWESRSVTTYDRDDGQVIESLAFTPDGETILFVRGGAANRAGDIPNPESDPTGVERTLFAAPFDGGEVPRSLATAGRFEVFPDGARVAYLRDGQLRVATLTAGGTADGAKGGDAGEGADAKPLLSVRHGISDFALSPDGAKIALITDRGDHAFVGVFDLAAATLIWLDPSIDHDATPTWSPDSSRVAWLRTPNEKQLLPFTPRRAGLPWSIHVADATTGAAREVFRADPGPGSANVEKYWFVGDGLWWGADDRIVFLWEKTGWLHLWSVAADGGAAVNLTPGQGEVQHAGLAPDGRSMLYAANHGDIDARHLWQVPVAGGSAVPLTRGEGIEWAPRRTAASGSLVYLASAATQPAHPEVMLAGQRRKLGPGLPDTFPAQQLVTPEPVTFAAADGLTVYGQLFTPPAHCGDGPHPGLLFFHGGSRRQMLTGFHPSAYYANAYAFNQTMASRCFVVMAVNYRSGVGYGLAFREAQDYGAQGASEYRDVVGAGLFLASRPDVDGDRIGLWGGSYGGYLTALGLARASDLFAAGVDVHGVHDWNVAIKNFAPAYDRTAEPEFAALALASSPMADLAAWTSPVLLVHGDDDRNVPFSQTVDLAEALRRQGTPMESLVFPDEVHGFLLHRSWTSAYRAASEFLTRHLGSAKD